MKSALQRAASRRNIKKAHVAKALRPKGFGRQQRISKGGR